MRGLLSFLNTNHSLGKCLNRNNLQYTCVICPKMHPKIETICASENNSPKFTKFQFHEKQELK